MRLSDLLAAILRLLERPAPSISPSETTSATPAPQSPPADLPKPEAAPAAAAPAISWLDLCRPLTEHFESCRLTAYPDPASGGDPWTCGWGTTGPDVKPGTVWTQAQADSRLTIRLDEAADDVDRLVKVLLTPSQKAALVDFTYNLGAGNLASSTLLKLLNAGNYQSAADEFPSWDMAAGKKLAGLVARRAAERTLFLTGAWKP